VGEGGVIRRRIEDLNYAPLGKGCFVCWLSSVVCTVYFRSDADWQEGLGVRFKGYMFWQFENELAPPRAFCGVHLAAAQACKYLIWWKEADIATFSKLVPKIWNLAHVSDRHAIEYLLADKRCKLDARQLDELLGEDRRVSLSLIKKYQETCLDESGKKRLIEIWMEEKLKTRKRKKKSSTLE
jgi:hypothetical protein